MAMSEMEYPEKPEPISRAELRRRILLVRRASGLSALRLSRRMVGDENNTNNLVWLMEKGTRNVSVEDVWDLALAAQGLNLLHETPAAAIVSYLMGVADDLPLSVPAEDDDVFDNPLRMQWEQLIQQRRRGDLNPGRGVTPNFPFSLIERDAA